ncbi:MAG: hypothetical protein D6798_10510 [Deltaproteobacteria bacterium]|nr:MAG: hypothetical protein D6798_10510 [Deltaproteobacteria bacterium]
MMRFRPGGSSRVATTTAPVARTPTVDQVEAPSGRVRTKVIAQAPRATTCAGIQPSTIARAIRASPAPSAVWPEPPLSARNTARATRMTKDRTKVSSPTSVARWMGGREGGGRAPA